MVVISSGYHGDPFKGYRGVTHIDPLPPTIFNVVVDGVLRHWVMELSREEAVTDGFGIAGGNMATFFYVDVILLASMKAERPHQEFSALNNFFDRVVLRTNVGEILSMVCKTCQPVGGKSY